MDKQKFAFDKTNFILLAIGMAVVIIGFLLMTGPSSTEGYFEPDIFSVRRIKVAPAVCFWVLFYDIWYCAKAETNERIKSKSVWNGLRH